MSLSGISGLTGESSIVKVYPKLVAYYPFNSSLVDASGNGRNLTASSPTYATGQFGNALTSASSGPLRANRGFFNMSIGSGSYSVSFWFKRNGSVTSSISLLVDLRFIITTSLTVTWNNAAVSSTAYSIGDTDWHNVILVVKDKVGSVYIDGALHSSSDLSDITKHFLFSDSITIALNNSSLLIDDLAFMEGSLSPVEIALISGGVATINTYLR